MPLYIVGTPLGNLGDFSKRAADTLKTCDFIAAEDTRVTLKLLSRFDISTPLIAYHRHNRRETGEKIISRLQGGETGALVSDAGMPGISDPGAELVSACGENGIEVFTIPGPCALSSAVALSGFVTGRFTFEGFLSTANKSRREHLASLAGEQRPMVFYEAPHKLLRTLRALFETFGERRVSISREMTKIHEETLRGTLSEFIALYEKTPPKGEFTLVIEGKPNPKPPEPKGALEAAKNYLAKGETVSAAAKAAASDTGVPRREIYALLHSSPCTDDTI